MPNITIYVSDEIYKKLLESKSKSVAIQKALKQYYNLN
jgi:predicted CopG family antitoxin